LSQSKQNCLASLLEPEINNLIFDVYQLAYQHSIQEFKQAAIERFSQLVPIDGAFWMSRSEVASPYFEEETFTYGLPTGVMDNYLAHPEVLEQAQQLTHQLYLRLGQTVDVKEIIPQQEWLKSDMYLKHCKKYDIEHSLMTLIFSEHNQIIDSISFSRHAANSAFSIREKSIKQLFVPHLIEAQRINILSYFDKLRFDNQFYRAVLDRHGMIIEAEAEAEAGCLNLLTEAGILSDNKIDTTQLSDLDKSIELDIATTNEAGLIYLQVARKSLKELLTDKKQKICLLLAKGKSNKEIANELDVAVATVQDHLKSIYKILAVNSRHQAISYLLRQDWLS